ncbi:retrotransposon protein, putative, Ty3-gypsy subclass [Panicum miliaceum]|uniref:Retrotransposon protein, putative, Ty3-gypsy subclass n=1 Tax=Panicum miliaceum TaxID=4540 RepID=A0A3L6RUN3_PANMI|nr:retrotransposon protein, putative, Ty3-gypsy subclass [Panicum miliaceum]
MPRKSIAGRRKKRGSEGGDESSPLAKVAKTAAEGEWRSSTIWERDLLLFVAERAFLGIRPHFNLFRHLFHLKPQPDEHNPALVGGAGVKLCDKVLYLEYTTLGSLSGWHRQWFYIWNHKPSLPGRDDSPPQCQECWLEKLTEEESRDIPELMARIKALKDKGITEESVAYSFIERRIQPLQQRVHLGFEYKGIRNPARLARDVPFIEEIMRRGTRLFTGVNSEPDIPRLFSASNPLDSSFVECKLTWSGSGLTRLSRSLKSQPRIRPPRRPQKMLQPTRRAHSEWRPASGGPL